MVATERILRPFQIDRGGRCHTQRGVAIIVAMLAVTLVSAAVAGICMSSLRSAEAEEWDRIAMRTRWTFPGAFDWARAILKADAESGGVDDLTEPWARGVAETSLSAFFARPNQGSVAPSMEDAEALYLSLTISDMQSKLNVQNLIENGKVSAAGKSAFFKLFEQLNLPTEELEILCTKLLAANSEENLQDQALQPQRIEDLRAMGLSPKTIETLRGFVTVLPEHTAVNLNTASAEVIYAATPGLDMSEAIEIVQARNKRPFANTEEAALSVKEIDAPFEDGNHSFASSYFEIRTRLRIGARQIERMMMVRRAGAEVHALWVSN